MESRFLAELCGRSPPYKRQLLLRAADGMCADDDRDPVSGDEREDDEDQGDFGGDRQDFFERGIHRVLRLVDWPFACEDFGGGAGHIDVVVGFTPFEVEVAAWEMG